MEQENEENIIEKEKFIQEGWTGHLAPCGAKNVQAFCGVILKSERPSGALFTNSGPPFFNYKHKIEGLSPLGTSFH